MFTTCLIGRPLKSADLFIRLSDLWGSAWRGTFLGIFFILVGAHAETKISNLLFVHYGSEQSRRVEANTKKLFLKSKDEKCSALTAHTKDVDCSSFFFFWNFLDQLLTMCIFNNLSLSRSVKKIILYCVVDEKTFWTDACL